MAPTSGSCVAGRTARSAIPRAWAGVTLARAASPVRPRNESRSPRSSAKYGAVAHRTRPSTRSRWRCHTELGDRTPHRVADRDEPIDAERVGDGDHVVGDVVEPERTLAPDPAPVAAVVVHEHAVVLAERPVARVPVDIGGRRPTVEEGDRRRTGRTTELTEVDRAATLELDVAPRRERRGRQRLGGDETAQARSTFRTRTRSSPFGAWYETHCPASAPTSAAPSGAVGLITSRPPICSSMWPTR